MNAIQFDGKTFTKECEAGPNWKAYSFRLEITENHKTATYWCAVGGKVFAIVDHNRNTCVASVNDMMHAQTFIPKKPRGIWDSGVYVITRPQNAGNGPWARWSKKWAQRTS